MNNLWVSKNPRIPIALFVCTGFSLDPEAYPSPVRCTLSPVLFLHLCHPSTVITYSHGWALCVRYFLQQRLPFHHMLESWTVSTEFSVRVRIKHGRSKVFKVRGPWVKRPTGGNEWSLYKGLDAKSINWIPPGLIPSAIPAPASVLLWQNEAVWTPKFTCCSSSKLQKMIKNPWIQSLIPQKGIWLAQHQYCVCTLGREFYNNTNNNMY